jgi:hypothetical protein
MDILFVQELLLENKRNFGVSKIDIIISNFEKIITNFEKLEFQNFLNHRSNLIHKLSQEKKTISRKRFSFRMLYIENNIFNRYYQSKIYHYWRVKLQYLNRPLLRCFWKIIHFPFHGFDKQDPYKIPFEPRPKKKKKSRLKSRCLKGKLMIPKLKELRKECHQLLEIIKMVKLREELKLQRELMDFFPFKNQKTEKVLDKVKDVLGDNGNGSDFSDFYEKEDMMVYCCNVVEDLGKIDMNLEDFKSGRIKRRMGDLKRNCDFEIIQDIQDDIMHSTPSKLFLIGFFLGLIFFSRNC